MVSRTLHLPDDVDAAFTRVAKESGRSIEDVLTAMLRDYEDRTRSVEEGRADVASGRVVGHDAMKAWLSTWGTADELDPPACPE